MHASTLIIILTSAIGALSAATPRCTQLDYAGVKMEMCANTVYEGDTITEFSGITNIRDCAKICAETAGCQRAVLEKWDSYCLLKGADSTGDKMVSKDHEAAVVTSEMAEGTVYTNCPVGASSKVEVGGTVFNACKNTDSGLESVTVAEGIWSAQGCAEYCASQQNCKVSTWAAGTGSCQIKQNRTSKVFRRGMTRMWSN